MTLPVRFHDSAFLDCARTAGRSAGRTLEEQILHWAKIGRAVEATALFDQAQVDRALAGEIDTTELTRAEHALWADLFVERLARTGPEEETFFSALRNRTS